MRAAILVVLLWTATAQAAGVALGPPTSRPWLGFGYNQYPVDRAADGSDRPWSEDHWRLTVDRTAALHPALVRVNAYRRWFCPGPTVGTYRWDTPQFVAYCRVLHLYDGRHVPVMTGLWGIDAAGGDAAPFVTSADAARLSVDLVRHLRDVEHLANVRWYTPINEPGGSAVSPAGWATLAHHTRDAFAAAGLPTDGLLGPDTWDGWTLYAAEHCRADLAGYDHHKYLNDPQPWLADGGLERYLRLWLDRIDRVDPDRTRPVLLTEGTADDPTDVDYPRSDPPFMTTPAAAVASLDYGVQVLRSGESGALAWALDGFDRGKDAGFYNLTGTHSGLNPRPWFHAWAALSRAFPPGGEVRPLAGCRGVVGRWGSRWSVAVVNRGPTPLAITVPVPAGSVYDRWATADPAEPTVRLTAAADGMPVTVPADGGVVLTAAP